MPRKEFFVRKILALAAVAAASLTSPAIAQSAKLTTNSSGQLTGATGLNLGALGTYDVSLVEGTCASLFNNCNSNSDFAFTNQADATTAGNALLGLIAGAASFNANPDLTFGCGPTYVSQCLMLIPYQVDSRGNVSIANATNNSSVYGVADTTSYSSLNLNISDVSTANDSSRVYAKFTQSPTAVPEPASWAMMLFGFGAVGMSLRSRQQKLHQLA
jgi:hypothetical protein